MRYKRSKKTAFRRHPLAEAIDSFFLSVEGKSCTNLDNLTHGPYLRNRLDAAIRFGWNAAEKHFQDLYGKPLG